MIRFILPLVMTASGSLAQDAVVDATVVEACLDEATLGSRSTDCIGFASGQCMDASGDGMTTVGMASCTAAETEAWDVLLNREYQDLRAQMREMDVDAYAKDPPRADALQDAQRAWIAFRDAECDYNWAVFQDGTMRSLTFTGCMLDMTARRTIELRNYRELPR